MKHGPLQGLAVTDPYLAATFLAGNQGQVGADPVNLFGTDAECLAPEPGVAVSFSYENEVVIDVVGNQETRLGMAADAQPLALPDGIILRTDVLADDLAVFAAVPDGLRHLFERLRSGPSFIK